MPRHRTLLANVTAVYRRPTSSATPPPISPPGTGTHRRQWAVLSYGSSLRAVLRAAAAAQGTDTQVVLCRGVRGAGRWYLVTGCRAALPYTPIPVLHAIAGGAAFQRLTAFALRHER